MEAIAARIGPLESRCKVGKRLPFDHVTHDPDPLLRKKSNQHRNQDVIKADDAERRRTAKRPDDKSMAAAGTKPQGNACDEVDSRENMAAGVKQIGIVGTTTRSSSNVASRDTSSETVRNVATRDTSSETAPKVSRVSPGKASMTRATDRPPHSSGSPQTVPLSMPAARQLGWPLHLPPLELVGTRPPQNRWLRIPNPLRLKPIHRMTKTTCTSGSGRRS